MNEAGRFMRFVIPGLVSLITLGVMFLITDRAEVIGVVLGNEVTGGIGSAIAVLLASGALGYVYANLYFMLFAWFDCLVQNHKPLFEGESARFRAVGSAGNPITIKKRRDAWILVCQYLYRYLETPGGKDIKGIDIMGVTLTHHIHSQGATAIGLFVAGTVWLLCKLNGIGLALGAMSCAMWWEIILLWLLLQFAFWFVRWQTITKHDRIVNTFLMDRHRLVKRPEDLYYVE